MEREIDGERTMTRRTGGRNRGEEEVEIEERKE